MNTTIQLDITDKENLYEKYNTNIINTELINYLVDNALYIKKEDKVTIQVNNICKTKENIKEIIINGLNKELDSLIKSNYRNNIIQIMLFLLGTIFLFLSTLISDTAIGKEVLIIIGWVPIWEMIYLELFRDSKNRRKIQVLKKLIVSDFEIN